MLRDVLHERLHGHAKRGPLPPSFMNVLSVEGREQEHVVLRLYDEIVWGIVARGAEYATG